MTKEEVIISLGLEDAQMRTGLVGTDFFIQNSVKHTLKSLKKLVAINVVEMAKDVIDIWDKGTTMLFENVFNLDHLKEVGTQLEKMRQSMAGLRKEGEGLRAAIQKELTKGLTSEMKLRDAEEIIQREGDAMMHFQSLAKGLGRVNPEAAAKFTAEALKHELAWNAAINEKAELQEKLNDEADKENEERKKNLELLTRQIKLNEAHKESIAKAANALHTAQFERGSFSLNDLAGASFMQNTRWSRMAREVLQSETWSKENRMLGFNDLADRQQSYADKLYKQLVKENPHLKDPQRETIDKLNMQLMELQKLNTGVTLKQSAN